MVVERTEDEGGAARGDPRRRARRVRRARAARRLDRRDRPAGRHLAAVRLPALRHEEGALHRPSSRAASARRSRSSSGRPRASAARRRCRRSARRTASCSRATGTYLRGADAGLRGLRRPGDPRGRPHGYGDLVAYVERVSGADGGDRGVLRERDADERARLDGAATTRPSRGRSGCSRAARTDVQTSFFRPGGK